MNKVTCADLMALKKTFLPTEASFRTFASCYVMGHEIEAETKPCKFLNMPEEDKLKYLNMLKSTVKADMYLDKILVAPVQHQAALRDVILTEAKDNESLQVLYNIIAEYFDSEEDFAIFVFYDVYDIPNMNKAGEDLEESTDVWEHIVVMVCKVTMEEAGIIWDTGQKCFHYKPRRWQVDKKPTLQFTYPALVNHSVDHDQILVYNADAEYPQVALMEDGFGMEHRWTSTQFRKKMYDLIVRNTGKKAEADHAAEDFANRCYLLTTVPNRERKQLTKDEIREMLKLDGCPEARQIAADTERWLYYPYPEQMYTKKLLNAHNKRAYKKTYINLLSLSKDMSEEFGQEDLAGEITEFLAKERDE